MSMEDKETQEGIKKVVDYIEENAIEQNQYWNSVGYPSFRVNTEDWQAKLKEWGLK